VRFIPAFIPRYLSHLSSFTPTRSQLKNGTLLTVEAVALGALSGYAAYHSPRLLVLGSLIGAAISSKIEPYLKKRISLVLVAALAIPLIAMGPSTLAIQALLIGFQLGHRTSEISTTAYRWTFIEHGTLEELFAPDGNRSPLYNNAVIVAKYAALLLFNRYAVVTQPYLWVISALLGGTLCYGEVEKRVTEPICQMYTKALLLGYAFLVATNLPGVLIMQAVLSGADLGRRIVNRATA
jgi:hypothetical protein